MRSISFSAILLFIFSTHIQAQNQTVQDDFEGNGTISTWFGDNCNINTNLPNPYQGGINTSPTVLEYHDVGGQYANVRFDVSNNFDLASAPAFELKIYVPASGVTGSQTNQVSSKLQDGTLAQPWLTQSEIIKPIALDQWQTVTFDFSTDNYFNLDPNSPPPTQRTDFNRVLIQVNGENNYDQVLAYIDDVYYKASSEPDPDPDPEFDVLVWSDEFDTDGAIDNTKWFQESKLPTPTSWHNGEIQHYTDRTDNSNVKNGVLNIIGKKETYTDQGVTKEYTSARLNSKFAFQYGKVEVRAKLPSGVGTWPAIWTLGKNFDADGTWWDLQGYGTTPWPACGEIDIMEHWGANQNYVSSATHTPSSYGGTFNKGGQTISNASTEFHTYTLEWYPDKLVFSVDGVSHYTYQPNEYNSDTWPFNAEQYLILNFAILPEIDPNFTLDTLSIDYVRVYQNKTSDPADYFTDYDSLIAKLNELTSASAYASELNAFWNDLIASENFPFAIGSNIAFLYRGTANSVSWAGDFNEWDKNADPGVRLGVSNIWILEKELPSDARSGYKIVINGNEWIADEHNPFPLSEGYGNSVLRMPDYTIPDETIVRPSVPKGNVSDNILKFSSNLNYTCQYKVYTPAGYEDLSGLPVIYVTDGQEFSDASRGKMKIILDNLIYDQKIEPLIAVFLDPRDPDNLSHNRRSNEYRNNINFVNYVTSELIPDIDGAYKTDAKAGSRAIAGFSYGGYNAAYFCAMAYEDIQNTAILSPIMHPNPPESGYTIYSDMMAANLENTKIYMSYGIFDTREKNYFEQLKTIFGQKDKSFKYDIVNEGHTMSNWSGVIGNALNYFFPGEENDPPVVSDIPDQTKVQGNSFATIQLDNFVSDENHADSEITWTFSGNVELIVNIDENRIATITMPQDDWTGTETIAFTATDPQGDFDSDTVLFTSDPGTMISGEYDEKMFSVYPNPASEKVTVTVPGKIDLSIFTISGQKILEKKIIESGFIDVAGFSKGVYLLSGRNKNGMIIKKLMIE